MKNLSPILVVGLLLFGLALGCKLPGSDSKKPESNAAPAGGGTAGSQSPAASPETTERFSPSNDAMADIKASSKRFADVQSFQAVMDSSGGKSDMHLEMQFAAPDRYHMISSAADVYIIGKETYMKLNGVWRKFPLDIGSSLPKMREMLSDDALKTIHDAKYLGDESVDGTAAMIYQYQGKGLQGDGSTYTSKIWISKIDGLPLKFEAQYNGGPLKTVTTTYAYKNIPVEAPTGE